MSKQKNIDKVAQQVAKQTEQLQREMVRDLRKLSKDKRFKAIDEFITAVDQLDITAIVLLKSKNIIEVYSSAHTQVLKEMELFAEITEDTLRALTNFSTTSFADHLGSMGGVMKREIIQGVITGNTEMGIFQAIQQQAGLSNKQMETLVTTGLNNYSRSVTKVQMDNAPKDKRYRYVGPIDGRTRDLCIQIWSAGEMTESQIIRQFGASVLTEGGGYNCRHDFAPIDTEDKSKDMRTDPLIKNPSTKAKKPKYIQDLSSKQLVSYRKIASARSQGKISQSEFNSKLKDITDAQ